MNQQLSSLTEVSNASQWQQICQHQVRLLGALKQQFPEREQQLDGVTALWQQLQASLAHRQR